MAAIVVHAADEPLLIASNVQRSDNCDGGTATIELGVPANLKFFEGHFPGCALLPGVVQLNWAVQFGRRHFPLPPRFQSLANIKFMRVITPGSKVQLALGFSASSAELSFEYRISNAICSSGTICFRE